jgi:uncharacterized protein YdhG (YjbR/CyaY superfamily)
MPTIKKNITTIDEYIAQFPENVRKILEQFRQTIRKIAPEAEETISYQMPAFRQKRILVYFAAFENHIGFYPTPTGIEKFRKELSEYEVSKGTVRFPIDKPVPYALVEKIVKFRVREISPKK